MKNITRIMAAVVCGAIVASTSSVAAFAGNTSGHYVMPTDEKFSETNYRAVKIAGNEHATIVLENARDGYAKCDSTVMVRVIADDGFFVTGISTDSYCNDSIKDLGNGLYTFTMPWADPQLGVTVSASVAVAK